VTCCGRLFQTRKAARSRLGRLAAWHLPGGPVGPPAWWAAASNAAGGSLTEEGATGPLAREEWFSLDKLFARALSS